jgi:hypothetical protein
MGFRVIFLFTFLGSAGIMLEVLLLELLNTWYVAPFFKVVQIFSSAFFAVGYIAWTMGWYYHALCPEIVTLL